MSNWSNPTKYSLGLDTSHHAGELDVPFIVEESTAAGAPVRFINAKIGELSYLDQNIDAAGDKQWDKTVVSAYKAGIPLIGFIMHNAQYYAEATGSNIEGHDYTRDKQIALLCKFLRNRTFHAIEIDLERYWIDYDEYYAALAGKISMDELRKIPNGVILRSVRRFRDNIFDAQKAGWIKRVPVILYSRESFIKEFTTMPDGGSLYDDNAKGDWLLHEARYPYAKGAKIPWADLPSKFPADNFRPIGMNGVLSFWQFSGDQFVLPISKKENGNYNYGGLDLSVAMMPPAQLYEKLNYTSTPTPTEPEPEEPAPQPAAKKLAEALTKLDEVRAGVVEVLAELEA